MTDTQLEVWQDRAENGAFVISKLEDGFRVYAIQNPSHLYHVRQEGERWTCTCPDFEAHKADTTWRCKHILAVAPLPRRETAPAAPSNGNHGSQNQIPPVNGNSPTNGRRRPNNHGNGSAQMLIKRSVSPDGRIDSVSVEFSISVTDLPHGEIKAKALTMLKLQKEITTEFLKLNGDRPASVVPPASKPPEPTPENGQPAIARMIDIGKMNGKWGDRFFINFALKGGTSRLFGTPKQLAEHIQSAGYAINAGEIGAGLRLDFACRATTKRSEDGKYLNIDRVFPANGKPPQGGADDGYVPF